MINSRCFFYFFLTILTTQVNAQDFQSVTDYEISFKIKNAGLNVGGSLKGLDADIFFNPQQPGNAKIVATADVNTIETGINARDKHLKKSDYFDAENFPKIKLQLQELINGNQENQYQATFLVTIKGVDKSIRAPLSFTEESNGIKLSSSFKLNRLDFGVGSKSFILSRNVTVTLQANLEKG